MVQISEVGWGTLPRKDVVPKHDGFTRIAAPLSPRERVEEVAEAFIRGTKRTYEIEERSLVFEVRFYGRKRRVYMTARFSMLEESLNVQRTVDSLEAAWRKLLEENA